MTRQRFKKETSPDLQYCKVNVIEIMHQVDAALKSLKNQQDILTRHGLWSNKNVIYKARKYLVRKELDEFNDNKKVIDDLWTIIKPVTFKNMVELLFDEVDYQGERLLTLYDNRLQYDDQPDLLYHVLNNFYGTGQDAPHNMAGLFRCYKTSISNTENILIGNVEIIYNAQGNYLSTVEQQLYDSDASDEIYNFNGTITLPNKKDRCIWLDKDVAHNQEHMRELKVMLRSPDNKIDRLAGRSYFSHSNSDWCKNIFLERMSEKIAPVSVDINHDLIPNRLRKYLKVDSENKVLEPKNIIKFFPYDN